MNTKNVCPCEGTIVREGGGAPHREFQYNTINVAPGDNDGIWDVGGGGGEYSKISLMF